MTDQFGRRVPHIIPTPMECAYAAGFFDGEGNITIAMNHNSPAARGPIFNMRIGASQNDIGPLLWLREHVLQAIPKGERAVLEVLIASYPAAVDRDAITERTGYQRSSRDAYLQRLSARELIEAGRGDATASATLFD